MSALFRRLFWFLRRRRFEADLTDELRFHEEMAAADAQHAGADAEEARFAARRRLGNMSHTREDARAVWSPPALDDLGQDFRYALRGLRRRPGYTAAATLTLLLGIGATTALFSVLNAVLFRPLPYPDSGALVQVWEHNIPRNRLENVVSPANYLDWHDRARSFEALGMYTWTDVFLLGDTPEDVSGRVVTTNFFAMLRARPLLGRLFVPEDTVGTTQNILLSYGLWKRRFHADPSVVGKPLQIRGGNAMVVGVMPEDFRPLSTEEYWRPWSMRAEHRQRQGRYAMVIGRLKPGVTAEAAQQEMRSLATTLEKENPDFNTGWSVDVVPLQTQVTGKARPVLLMLAGAIGAVLLIACANVANLKLGQVLARRTELAVRTALGASRGRILQQMMVEGLVLALLGGVLGTVAAVAGIRALVHAQVRQIPRLAEVGVNGRVLAFAVLITAVAGVIFGLAPALAFKEKSLRQPLSRRDGGSGQQAGRIRGMLVSLQVALCLLLLTGAGLTVRSLMRLVAVDPGFDPSGVLTVELSLPNTGYEEPARRFAFFEELSRRVGAMPGVREVGLVNFLPLRGITPGTSVHVQGVPEPPPGQVPVTEVNTVDEHYFSTLRTPLIQGRGFNASDRMEAPKVVLINEAFAKQILKGTEPLGQHLKVDMADPDTVVTVIGVVGDMRREGLDVDARPSVYYPWQQSGTGYMTLVIRAAGNPALLMPGVTREVTSLDRSLPILSSLTLEEYLAGSMENRRYPMMLLSLLAGLALVLSAVGLYGVLAYIVGQRSREIGLRRALGATPGSIAGLVLGEGLRFVGIGVAAGIGVSLLTTRFLDRLLYDLPHNDPATLVLVSVTLLAVAGLASWLPARRALRVDPVTTLREE